MRTRIFGCALVPGVENEPNIPFVQNAEVQVDGNLIAYAGTAENAPPFEAEQQIDASGCICMPGLVNLHTHTPMTFLRSAGADLMLSDWLNQVIFKLEAQWNRGLIRTATDLGCMEMLRFGTTSFCDMYMYTDSIVKAVRDNGMRALIGHGVVDTDGSCKDLEEGVELAKNWNRTCNDRIRVSIAPHAEYTSTPALMKAAARAAIDMDIPFHTHVSETKAEHEGCIRRRRMTPLKYLQSCGALDAKVIAAHCVWFSDEDIDLAAKYGITVVHNPVSNLKLASGVAPIAKMLGRGCSVALGTDSVASNDNLNLWEEIKLMPLLQKGTTLDPTVIPPAQVLAAATSVGAKAMGHENLGLLKEGYIADLILLNIRTPHMTPHVHPESNLIYALQGSDVTLTMVDGKVLFRDGEYTTIDAQTVLRDAEEGAAGMYKRFRAMNA
ncbi:MAG: amidohydrolase [Clostridiales bacterium]|nr:amidohydrolase [Clostridiales bacterium]